MTRSFHQFKNVWPNVLALKFDILGKNFNNTVLMKRYIDMVNHSGYLSYYDTCSSSSFSTLLLEQW